MLTELLKKQKAFLTAFVIWIVLSVILLLLADKIYWQQFFDARHSLTFDYFFKYFTWFGDGLLIAILSILFAFYRIRLALFSLTTYLVSGLFAQLLKRFVFDDVNRPGYVFDQINLELTQVLNVGLKSYHSFPSGHTTSAFAFFFVLSIMLAGKNQWGQLLFFAAAFLVGFSRVYLNLHFVNDVVMGSLLGVLTTFLMYPLFSGFKAQWLDKPLGSIIFSKKR
ncbi:undecaprenyl pyrophosphate phosphatase [Salinivirga cyanobacteriivorans]|uniref:Undecaprenyl pyrophosphate phosphatase n=1 Tax=Salinivirga cyanobacteriivorans TaxID=1307839 RepID=A0A0S2I0K3_9BACT|nr:phosphatase PAP2 family protein [Salinivirga cyanobacteriivorans]ALO15822.1 undecaprenyl pyrophosphate phosphatase [Salinivirga cyanobacteriivorans]